MQKKVIEFNTFKLHMFKTTRFNSLDIRVVFRDDFKKEDITYRNFLSDILVYSTKNYPTKRLLSIKCQDLYSTFISSSNVRLGRSLLTSIGLSSINQKYTEEGILDENIKLLSEVIFNPNVCDKSFEQKSFSIIRNDLVFEMKSVDEKYRLFSNVRMLENMDKSESYTYHGYCYPEDLEKVTPVNLYTYYQNFIKNSLIDIYVVGDFDINEMTNLIKDNFKFNYLKKPKKETVIKHKKYRLRPKTVIEKKEMNQSKLCIGCKLKDLDDFEFKYVSNIYNMLLGNSSNSYLMKNIREKYSLAYYISSYLNKGDNLIIINSGISANNFKKVVLLIKKEMSNIKNGSIDERDIENCKMEFINTLNEALEEPSGIIDMDIGTEVFHSDDVEKRLEMIKKVSKVDIVNYANKVCIDTIYLLKGDEYERI